MGTRQFAPGSLITTLHPAALPSGAASAAMNCDLSRGIWERGLRQRRFQQPPVRTVVVGGAEEIVQSWRAPSSVVAVSRSGQNATFVNSSNARLQDGSNASCSPLNCGSKTEFLKAILAAPTTIPSSATGIKLQVEVFRQVDPDSTVVCDVVDDEVRLQKSGSNIGSNSASVVDVPVLEAAIAYEWNLSTLSVPVADINAGQLDGVLLGWRSDPTAAYVPSNFTVAISISSPNTTFGDSSGASVASQVTITVTRISGPSVGEVFLDVTSMLEATVGPNPGPAVASFSGTASADNGLGQTDSGSITTDVTPDPAVSSRVASGKKKVRVVLTANVGTFVFTPVGSVVISAAASGNLGKIIRTISASIVQPDNSTLLVNSVRYRFKYTVDTSTTVTLDGAQGIGYGDFAGTDEFGVVWGEGAFATPAARVNFAMSSNWGSQQASLRLGNQPWAIWQYEDKLFYATPSVGVYYRKIGNTEWNPLYKDSQSPGSTGDATAQNGLPPYFNQAVFDAGSDTVAVTTNGGYSPATGLTVSAAITSNKVTIDTNDWVAGVYLAAYIEFEVTLSTVRNLTQGNVIGFRISNLDATGAEPGNDGFPSNQPSDVKLTLTDNAGTPLSDTMTAKFYGVLDGQKGYAYGFCEVPSSKTANWASVKKIKIRFPVRQTGRGKYRLESLFTGGYLYRTSLALATQTPVTAGALEYAYRVTETGPGASQAKKLVVSGLAHLGGVRPFGSLPGAESFPYLGSMQSITVLVADAPYTSAATIQLFRMVAGSYRRIATGPNTVSLVFDDKLTDAVIAADTTTYPIATDLTFDPVPPSFSGVASGIIAGCSWKGSCVFAHTNGKIYFSRSGDFTQVLWDDVVLTNDVGSTDLGPPRTSVLADNTSDYALCLVPAENLYCFTARAAYVFVAGETAATSSFPRRIDGVRGAVGIRAATAYGDRALVGSQDGLWAVKKSSDYGEQPDELLEVTKDIRGSWAWLLGTTPETTVVRHRFGEIWVFNRGRFLWRSRAGLWSEGVWQDGREVVDAVADPTRGLVLQANDGHLLVIGDFPTDGGTVLAGSDGAAFRWVWSSEEWHERLQPIAVLVHANSDSASEVRVDFACENGSASVNFAADSALNQRVNVDRVSRTEPFGGGWGKITLSGLSTDRVTRLEMDAEPRETKRGA